VAQGPPGVPPRLSRRLVRCLPWPLARRYNTCLQQSPARRNPSSQTRNQLKPAQTLQEGRKPAPTKVDSTQETARSETKNGSIVVRLGFICSTKNENHVAHLRSEKTRDVHHALRMQAPRHGFVVVILLPNPHATDRLTTRHLHCYKAKIPLHELTCTTKK